ncbi:AaceriAFL012Cp [[Ashbya] aceris (nom. inval.)]|nr:AaceriAFL012Cp [[Ashbya] aceris (nom. inval.)]
MPHAKVAISLNSKTGVPLVFNIDDVRRLRELGVLGTLCGSLPTAAQQNLFLTVPLRLMLEDAMWLVLSGHAYFAFDDKLLAQAAGSLTAAEVSKWKEDGEKELAQQREQREREQQLKLTALHREAGQTDAQRRLLEQSLFLETENCSKLIASPRRAEVVEPSGLQYAFLREMVAQHLDLSNYLIYRYLREERYFLSAGGRFGARYVAYPGDPLRYHSHMAVQPAMDYYNESLDLLHMVGGGRLGTGVKKLWVVGGVRYRDTEDVAAAKEQIKSPDGLDRLLAASPPVSVFSIEWSGFG